MLTRNLVTRLAIVRQSPQLISRARTNGLNLSTTASRPFTSLTISLNQQNVNMNRVHFRSLSTENKSSDKDKEEDNEKVENKKTEESSVEEEEVDSKTAMEIAEEEIEKLQSELGETKDQLLRSLAESENIRQRNVKEVANARTYGIQKFAKDLLSVSDNLSRALHSIPAEEVAEDKEENHHLVALYQGVEMTSKELSKVFQTYKISQFGEQGEIFDPHKHEAMFQVPYNEEQEDLKPNTIAQVVETGFMINDRVIRPARVGTVAAKK